MAPSIWAVTYNDNITAIFGGGNPDTGWTSESGNGITLALRGKQRYPSTSTANVNGVYSYATGLIPPNNNRAVWNWEFSINSGTATLDAYDYYVGVDLDPSAGINYSFVNALTFWSDNSYGNNGTANGAGLETGLAAALLAGDNIAQQSQNLVFAGGNPLLDATYNYELFAVAKGGGASGAKLADVGITVVVGRGGAAVPDAGSTLSLLGLGMAGLASLNFRKQK